MADGGEADDHDYSAPNPVDPAGLEALDEIFMTSMTLLQECLEMRSKLTKSLQLGYHLLAKARYVMGNKRVGTAQLPGPEETITASSTVKSNLPPDSDCYFFNLVTKNDSEIKESIDGLGPVHRVTKPDGTDCKEEEEDKGKNMEAKELRSDPLRWFGVLVPQELRSAQAAFKKATELSVEVVNLQMKIEHASRQFWAIIHNASSILCNDEP